MKRHWEWPWSESRAESITRTPGGLRSWVGGGVISLFYVPAFFSSCVSVARELCGGFYDLLKISLCYLLQISWALWFAAQHPLRTTIKKGAFTRRPVNHCAIRFWREGGAGRGPR